MKQKQKILDEALERQESLGHFFDNCPNLMGITEVKDVDGDYKISVKLSNPATFKLHEQLYGIVYFFFFDIFCIIFFDIIFYFFFDIFLIFFLFFSFLLLFSFF